MAASFSLDRAVVHDVSVRLGEVRAVYADTFGIVTGGDDFAVVFDAANSGAINHQLHTVEVFLRRQINSGRAIARDQNQAVVDDLAVQCPPSMPGLWRQCRRQGFEPLSRF